MIQMNKTLSTLQPLSLSNTVRLEELSVVTSRGSFESRGAGEETISAYPNSIASPSPIQIDPGILFQGGSAAAIILAIAVLIGSITKLIEVLIPVMMKARK